MAQASVAGKGLEGVTATTSAVSSIIGSTLTYRGYDINDLAEHSTFAEVIYLLWNGELPTAEQLERLRQDLKENREVSPQLLEAISGFPSHVDTMLAVISAVSELVFYDPDANRMDDEANRRKAIRILAKFPTLVAAIVRTRAGKEPISPDPQLDEAANFLYMLHGAPPTDLTAKIMDIALILHADHELNASTFAARVAASTLSDMHSAVVAALCTLKGPLHGGANRAVMRMLRDIGTVDNVTPYIRGKLQAKERVMGFGHRVYKDGDPRARWLKKMSGQLAAECGDPRWYEMSLRVEDEVKQDKGLLPNVDFYSASVYTYLNIPDDMFTPIFAQSRVSGYIAHILEQYGDNRLIRPRAEYVGPDFRSYVTMDRR